MTIAQLLADRAAQHGERTFLFWQDAEISYRELWRRAGQAAVGLLQQGVRPGETVGVMMANRPEYLVALFGIWWVGAVACPINPALTDEEAGYIVSHARLRALVRDAERALPPVPTVFATVVEGVGEPPQPWADDAATASLIYTSGTTGRPKGVMLTHASYLWDATATAAVVGLGPTDRFLGILPLFHVNAQVATTLCPLIGGAQVVLLPRFAPDTFLRDVARYRATAFSAVPTVYAILLARAEAADLDLSSLRFGICGAAPMPVEVFERFEARFGIRILEGYGLTEGTCVSSVNPQQGMRKIGSIGLPLPGQDMRIVDDQDQALPDGGVGEIVVRGPNVMLGYYDDAAATAAVLRDGWLHTGDLGTRDGDGYYTIVGRKKDMIIRGGENIYPMEIEETLHRHPDVSEAAVVGLPDPVWGEQVGAVVVLRASHSLEAAALLDWCRPHLASFKLPCRVVFAAAADLPRTATGKIQKNRLRDRFFGGS